MKIFLVLIIIFLISLFINSNSYSQEINGADSINRNNYYDYFVKPSKMYAVRTSWLSQNDILEKINTLLREKGYRIIQSVTYKLDSCYFISLPAYDFYNKIGYYYQEGHGPCENDRGNPKIYWQYAFNDSVRTFHDLKTLPKNIIVIKEDWYWYQEIISDSKVNIPVVSKEIINKILEQDINYYFKEIH
jgi:hypothetical protein